MRDSPQFYQNDDEFNAFLEQLKLTSCPHCQAVGTLIRHGFFHGFDDSSPHSKTIRARRIFCSNRNARPGCGKTFSVWIADKIRRLSLTTRGLWRFLLQVVADGVRAALRGFQCHLHERTLLRIWKRFRHAQCHIRTALAARCPPPLPPNEHRPVAQVLAHLRHAFPDAHCAIAAFQHTMRTFLV